MTEERAGPSVGVVMDAPGSQRFAERLIRSGIQARVDAPGSFDQQPCPGQLYIIPAGLSAAAVGAAARGAHVCVIPPWPVEPVTFGVSPGASLVSVAQVPQARGARYAAALAAQALGEGKAGEIVRPLRILYRERLAGASGLPLVESDAGDPLMVALSRTSNRHGHVIVTTLQLSVASAQTQLADVTRLIRDLYDWLLAHSEPAATIKSGDPSAPVHANAGEVDAPLVAMALALVLDEQAAETRITVEDAWVAFNTIRDALRLTAEQEQFDAGLAWLAAHRVVSFTEHRNVMVERAALEQYSVRWGLGPRLRRLRHLTRGAESQE